MKQRVRLIWFKTTEKFNFFFFTLDLELQYIVSNVQLCIIDNYIVVYIKHWH